MIDKRRFALDILKIDRRTGVESRWWVEEAEELKVRRGGVADEK